jgi:hypothetical protein
MSLYELRGNVVRTWQYLSMPDVTHRSVNGASAIANQPWGFSGQNSGRRMLTLAYGAAAAFRSFWFWFPSASLMFKLEVTNVRVERCL